MGLEALVAALEADAERAATAIRARATAEAEALRREAAALALAERGRRLDEVARVHEAASAERVAAATRRARVRVLEAERSWLERVRRDAEQELSILPLERWAPAIPALVGTALWYAGGDPVTIHCAPEAEDLVWSVAGAREATTVRGVPGTDPGLVLISDDARLTVPLTVRARLGARWPDLQLAALALLEDAP